MELGVFIALVAMIPHPPTRFINLRNVGMLIALGIEISVADTAQERTPRIIASALVFFVGFAYASPSLKKAIDESRPGDR